ncbi:MAG: lipopolysaccharide kinase InaA family protein [Verrucomicrobiota bacterium]
MNRSEIIFCNTTGVLWNRLPGDDIAFVDKNWIETLREAGLQAPEDFFTAIGETLSKPGLGGRYRARISLPEQKSALYLKRYGGEKFRDFLNRRFESGSAITVAEHEVTTALALKDAGVRAVQPVAFGLKGKRGPRQQSFVVTVGVDGESLENFFRSQKQITRDEKLRIIRAVAELAAKFHGGGWRHRDFYCCHIFMAKTRGEISLTLIDLARVFRPRWRAERWQIKDLAQLNYSAPAKIFSRADRLRFAQRYFGGEKLSPHQKQILRKVARKTEAIARHDAKRKTG